MKILRAMMTVLVALSIGLGPSLVAHALTGSPGGLQAAASPQVAASHNYAQHDHAASDMGTMSGMDGDCHGVKPHGGRDDAPRNTPKKGCCADGNSCAAACLAKCFHLLAVLTPADARLAFSIAHVPIAAFTLPSGWIYGPAPPPPRA